MEDTLDVSTKYVCKSDKFNFQITMNKVSLIVFCLTLTNIVLAQYVSHNHIPDTTVVINNDPNDPRVEFANTITGEDIKAHLSILASDEYEGRETGEDGNNKAADYIADQFKGMGLAPTGLENTYFQPVIFSSTGWKDTELFVGETKYKHLWDYLAYPGAFESIKNYEESEILFLGYGIDDPAYSDYKGKMVKGKTIMIYNGEPNKGGVNFITGNSNPSVWGNNTTKKLELAKSKGVEMVYIVNNDIKAFLMENRKYLIGSSLQLGDIREQSQNLMPHAYISTTMAEEMIGKNKRKVSKAVAKMSKKGKSKSIKLPTTVTGSYENYINLLEGQNVLGFVEGTDLKDEVIVVSAHYDHLGKRNKDIFNGADDNGSGTSTVLDIASAFQQAKLADKGPRRSILFLLVTGEEKGLLGSQWYAENPTVPLENIVANVNVDMIGRIDTEHDHDNYIYVIGSDRISTDLHKINEQMNDQYIQMELDYTYNSEEDPNRYYYRSDHYNFAERGIPAIFYFSGVHEDYHRPTDTVEKILFDKVERTGRLIFQTTWELANRDQRIKVDVDSKP